MMLYGSLILFSFLRPSGDSVLISALLRDIAHRQVETGVFYKTGTFPSTRVHASRPGTFREDNNIFFTGLIGFGLRQLRPRLSGEDLARCDTILVRMQPAFACYRSRSGRPTYSFWPVDPPTLFPGDPLLGGSLDRKGHMLPDDLDDTMIILEAAGEGPDSLNRAVKALMDAHANGTTGTVHTSYRRYRRLPVYSTWFGRRMPIDIDLSVLCNALYWVCERRLPFGPTDSATVLAIRDAIVRGLPVTDPAYASPHYARTPVVLYHIGRLLGRFSLPALDSLKPLLLTQTRNALASAADPMDKVLLSTTLLRLGASPASIAPVPLSRPEGLQADPFSAIDGDFVLFIASLSDYFRNPFRRVFLHTRFLRYEFRCTAYNRFLLLEYLTVRQAAETAVR